MAHLVPSSLASVAAALLAAIVLAGVALLAGSPLLLDARRRTRMLRRLGEPSPPGDDQVEREVCLDGQLRGARLVSTFSGPAYATEEPHPRASTALEALAGEEGPRLVVGAESIALVGPLQVVLGTKERRRRLGDDVVSVRRLADGELARAVGRLVRAPAAPRGGYRDVAARFELHPPATDPGHPPIAMYALRGGTRARGVLLVAAGLASLAGAAVYELNEASDRAQVDAFVSPPHAVYTRPPCAAEVDARLDASDPWAARDLTTAAGCDDLQGRAEASWMLGEVERAEEEFAAWRARDRQHPYTVAEAEAAMIARPERARELLAEMKTQWYRGPDDIGQATFGCLLDGMSRPSDEPCAAGPARGLWRSLADRKNIEFLPGYSLHDPTTYARFTPLEVARWPGIADGPLVRSRQQTELANRADRQMLHAAITGETEAYQQAARVMDDLVPIVERLDRLRFDAIATGAGGEVGAPRSALDDERDSIHFDAQRDLSVATSAAFFAHDDARVKRYLPIAEAHSRGIVEEHLRLVAGTQAAPVESHHPSDYSDIDMELFAEVGTADPAAFARKLEDAHFTSPACLADFLSSRPQLHAAVRAQMDKGYLGIPRLAPLYTTLDAAFRRRFAAGVVGDPQLEARWLTVTRNLGAALRRDGALVPVVSLESLLTKEP
jgi:hypothetical protein